MEKYLENITILYYGCMLFRNDEKLKDVPKDCIYDDGMKSVIVHLPGALFIYNANESITIDKFDISNRQDEISKLESLVGKPLSCHALFSSRQKEN